MVPGTVHLHKKFLLQKRRKIQTRKKIHETDFEREMMDSDAYQEMKFTVVFHQAGIKNSIDASDG